MAAESAASEGAAAPLIVSVSGIRGVVGRSLTPQIVADFAAAYGASRAGGTVAVARDGRSTGEMFAQAASAALAATGCRVLDLGVAATPTIGFYVKHCGAAGGVQISASHNPPEWNGLKLFRSEGFVLSPADGLKVADAYLQKRFQFAAWDGVGTFAKVGDPHAPHQERVLSLVDAGRIRRRKFKVVLDANHGAR